MPIHVAPWLKSWWNFWVGISAALYWPAWSAIFSASALFWAIYLANLNGRRDRNKDAALVLSAKERLFTVSYPLSLALERHESAEWATLLSRAKDMIIDDGHAAALENSKMDGLPTPRSIELTIAGLVKARIIVSRLKAYSEKSTEYAQKQAADDVNDMEHVISGLIAEAEIIRRGPLIGWMLRRFRNW